MRGLQATASSHTPCALKRLAIKNAPQPGRIYSWHISRMLYQNTFLNRSHILFNLPRPGEVKICPVVVISYQIIFKTTIRYFHYLFSSSGMRQSITRAGCHAIGKSSSFIEDFLAFCFL